MSEVILAKDIKLDSKHRVTVKQPAADHYRMKYFEDGRIMMEPMELVSKKAVEEMQKAVELVKNGVAGESVDLSQVVSILEEA